MKASCPSYTLLATIILTTACTPLSSTWQPLQLTASTIPRVTAKTVWIRDGYIPRSSEPDEFTGATGKLPPRSGAIVGSCFIRQANNGYLHPLADEQITIKSRKDGVFVTRTDENGIFIEIFTPGDYILSCRGKAGTVSIREGKTSQIRLEAE